MRKTVSLDDNSSASLNFLYHTPLGRIALKLLTKPFVSKAVGAYMNTPLSKRRIKGFVKKNNIDMSEYEKKSYISYNDFFTRRIKKDARPVDMSPDVLISPCDCKLSVYKLSADSSFSIKNSRYILKSFLKNSELAKSFSQGYLFIFRLTVDDYHRYCYVDSGQKGENVFIKGFLHTVQPISLDTCAIYHENCREYTVIESENFGTIIQGEVGAMMVGKIVNHHQKASVKKGEEKGMFEFGGSTCVLIVKKDVVQIDSDLISNTENHLETIVKYGERIAIKIKAPS